MTLRVICFLVFALVGNVVSLPRSEAQQATGTAAEVNVIVDDKVVDDLANRWREFVEDRAQRDDFSGAVLLAQGDRTALAQAYGQASGTQQCHQ